MLHCKELSEHHFSNLWKRFWSSRRWSPRSSELTVLNICCGVMENLRYLTLFAELEKCANVVWIVTDINLNNIYV